MQSSGSHRSIDLYFFKSIDVNGIEYISLNSITQQESQLISFHNKNRESFLNGNIEF